MLSELAITGSSSAEATVIVAAALLGVRVSEPPPSSTRDVMVITLSPVVGLSSEFSYEIPSIRVFTCAAVRPAWLNVTVAVPAATETAQVRSVPIVVVSLLP